MTCVGFIVSGALCWVDDALCSMQLDMCSWVGNVLTAMKKIDMVAGMNIHFNYIIIIINSEVLLPVSVRKCGDFLDIISASTRWLMTPTCRWDQCIHVYVNWCYTVRAKMKCAYRTWSPVQVRVRWNGAECTSTCKFGSGPDRVWAESACTW